MLKINEYKDKTSRSKEGRAWGNHLSAIGEGAGAWGWVAVVSGTCLRVVDYTELIGWIRNLLLLLSSAR
jgi:cytochrome c oxidase subunit IV